MKKLATFNERTKSLLASGDNLEHLHTLENFPVFMGCVDSPEDEDIVADMIWDICKDTGLIQLRKLIPLEILYKNQHNDGTGKIWKEHYTAFAQFLHKYKPKNILEVGGAHDQIARNYRALDQNIKWTIVEPNPEHIDDPQIKVIKAWFDDKFVIDEHFDTIIHSHVFEHTYNPIVFIEHISKFMKNGDKHIFTFPNLMPMLKLNWTNCINFEHTVFLTEYFTEYILEKYGFVILEKQYYGDPHSIFYATEKTDVPLAPASIENKYEEYKKVFMGYINYHLDMISDLNSLIEKSDQPIYLFGAHIFSQTLIQFGLKTDKIIAILDNSPIKQGKRLYGTNFVIESPRVLKNKGPVNVILRAGGYDEEIKKDILENINPQVTFW
ncbi:MAG: methyltransferase domain-containing protein [Candidatus Yonathbacteria bacterium]|nr:methyltransferase domain-containing protein [Candidatus Yonathbacteria bacterium]